VEDLVNEKVALNIPVYTEADIPIEKARKIPNVKMFFGEKYGERVRVVFIDESFSVEFCGGTHVVATGAIGPFKIVSEGSIASGVRRIEALSGDAIRVYAGEQARRLLEADRRAGDLLHQTEELARSLGRSAPHRQGNGSGEHHEETVTLASLRLLEQRIRECEALAESTSRELADLRKEASRSTVREAGKLIDEMVEHSGSINGFRMVSSRIDAQDIDQLKALGDSLRRSLKSGVGVLASVIDEKAMLVCVVTDDLIRGRNLQAGKIVAELAKRLGGGGGGKPHLATAGGRDIRKLDEVLRNTEEIVRSMMR
jgi:alanyl-tRNA synthetase